jgi:PiT family inorganic phosphate transporter
VADSHLAADALAKYAGDRPVPIDECRGDVAAYLQSRHLADRTLPAMRPLAEDISGRLSRYGTYARSPDHLKGNVRNDMYLVWEALRQMDKAGSTVFTDQDKQILKTYKKNLDSCPSSFPHG